MKQILILLGFASITCFCMAAPSGKNRASVGLQKLQSLAGNWVGKDERGRTVKTTFRSIAGQTAVMEMLVMPEMEEMVTIYSQDGEGIALLHYCPTNNQPRMRANPPPGDVKELDFEFEGAGNMADPSEGHEHKLVLEFQDKDRIIERWTWRSNGKDTEMIYHLVRNNTNPH